MRDLIRYNPAEFLVVVCVIAIVVVFACALSLGGGVTLCCP